MILSPHQGGWGGEVRLMLEQLGFRRIEFFGHGLGEFSRERKPSKEDYEMLVVAVK